VAEKEDPTDARNNPASNLPESPELNSNDAGSKPSRESEISQSATRYDGFTTTSTWRPHITKRRAVVYGILGDITALVLFGIIRFDSSVRACSGLIHRSAY
jgi:hypothetical protein